MRIFQIPGFRVFWPRILDPFRTDKVLSSWKRGKGSQDFYPVVLESWNGSSWVREPGLEWIWEKIQNPGILLRAKERIGTERYLGASERFFRKVSGIWGSERYRSHWRYGNLIGFLAWGGETILVETGSIPVVWNPRSQIVFLPSRSRWWSPWSRSGYLVFVFDDLIDLCPPRIGIFRNLFRAFWKANLLWSWYPDRRSSLSLIPDRSPTLETLVRSIQKTWEEVQVHAR